MCPGRQSDAAPVARQQQAARAPHAASDEELWAAVLEARDCVAFAELCRRHQQQLRSRAWRVTGCEELANDVTQEVLMRLWEAPHRFRPERGSLRSYLLSDCHGRAVDSMRSEDSRHRRSATWAGMGGLQIASAEELALRALRDRRLLELLTALPAIQREALLLAFMGGLPYRSVATALDVPEGTAKARIRAGLESLRAAVRASGPDPLGS